MALAISARSPKSWLISFRYGVSPQPAHAPENSNSGWSSCEPLTVSIFGARAVEVGDVEEELPVGPLRLQVASFGSMLMALCLATSLLTAGQTSTQMPQPVQSSGATWTVSRWPGSSLPLHGSDWNVAGASSRADAS